MEINYIISQIFVVMAMLCLGINYLIKDKKVIMLLCVTSSCLYGTQYLLLGAISGMFMNIVGVIRDIWFYINAKKKKKNIEYNNLYSYSFYEYLVKDRISLDDVLFIGIDSRYYNGDYNRTISGVMELMDRYNIKIPFIDIHNNCTIYQKHSIKFEKYTRYRR